jgi:HSP20 family molecular chaperone IbpA
MHAPGPCPARTDINTDKVQAAMKEGILTIRLPKIKQATRRVQIRA